MIGNLLYEISVKILRHPKLNAFLQIVNHSETFNHIENIEGIQNFESSEKVIIYRHAITFAPFPSPFLYIRVNQAMQPLPVLLNVQLVPFCVRTTFVPFSFANSLLPYDSANSLIFASSIGFFLIPQRFLHPHALLL